jgi:hypothetical protein
LAAEILLPGASLRLEKNTMTQTNLTISHLQIEHLRETLGIGSACPRLSWPVETTIPNWQQAFYDIECLSADGQPRGKTGKMKSTQSIRLGQR